MRIFPNVPAGWLFLAVTASSSMLIAPSARAFVPALVSSRQSVQFQAQQQHDNHHAFGIRHTPLFFSPDDISDEEQNGAVSKATNIAAGTSVSAKEEGDDARTTKIGLEEESTGSMNGSKEEEEKQTEAAAQEEKASTTASPENLLLYLQSLGAITNRGQFASNAQNDSVVRTVESLESMNPTTAPARSVEKMMGRWELVYSTTQLFRSSPFFMAGRAVCQTSEEAARYNWFCDMHRAALAVSEIRAVRQVVSYDRLISEFEVQAGAVPFLNDFTPFSYSGGLPVTINGAIVSSADVQVSVDGTGWELFMDTVEIKGSNLPGLRQLLDGGFKLQTRQLGDFLESNVAQYSNPRPMFRTTYLDDQFRINRDQDDNIFVYVKTSSSTEPTDYSKIDADLGLLKLLGGFNDAITKFYI